jgi:hypothetical protein
MSGVAIAAPVPTEQGSSGKRRKKKTMKASVIHGVDDIRVAIRP